MIDRLIDCFKSSLRSWNSRRCRRPPPRAPICVASQTTVKKSLPATKSHHKASCGRGRQWCGPAPPGWTPRQQSPRQSAGGRASASTGRAMRAETRKDCAHPEGSGGTWGRGVRRGILPHLFDDCRKSSSADCCAPRAPDVALARSLVGRAAAGRGGW